MYKAMTSEEQFTRLQTQFKKLDQEVADKPGLHVHPFLTALAKGDPPILPGEIYRYCMDSDPMDLLWLINQAAKHTEILPSSAILSEDGKITDLVIHMCLCAGQRRIEKVFDKNHYIEQELPRIAMTEQLTAALVAATWLNLGLVLRFGSNDKLEVVNLISDRAEAQFGRKTVEQTIDDEIVARIIDALAPPWENTRGIYDPDDVLAGIKRLEKQTGAGLMVGLQPNAIRRDNYVPLRNSLLERWGVQMFLYADSDSELVKA